MNTEPAPLRRIGLLGGTFDPPHFGHLILAELAADSLALDRVLFVPAADPPHKGALRSSAAHRVAMVERAIAGNPRFALSRVDLDRPGPHYSVEMVQLLQAEYPGATLVFLIGGDSLRDLPKWSRPDELIGLVRLGVMRRPGSTPDLAALERAIPGIRARVDWIDAPQIEISASVLAQRAGAGLSIRYQTPDAVCAYIEDHQLYRRDVETVTQP
ncbi:MAG: nicotinate (nicotinamide) nucleotide adenylyltransferase [Chloroflexi bacterium]|nr:nicotinate (nicotinamide) nucleotide adenylyltransferase [Chloroflexota bacterium]